MQALLGRDAESALDAGFIESVPSGASALLLTGEPGIGKTALLRAAIQAASARSYRVLTCQPGESETQLLFTALIDLFDDVLDEALPRLPELQRRALEVAFLRTGAQADAPNWQAVSLAVLGVLRSFSRDEPVVLAVDDLQWIDASSARVLEFVLRRVEPLRFGITVSIRAGERNLVQTGLERAIPEERLFDLAVGPLGLNELDQLLRSRLGTQFARPTLVRLHRSSRGNPFFALELGRALLQSGSQVAPGDPLPVPERLRELVRDRLEALGSVAREVLVALSALSQPTVKLLEFAVGSRERVAEGLSMAVEAGIIEEVGGRIQFTHPLYKSAIYEEYPRHERRRLHRQLALVVSDPEERARHMAVGAEEPDPAVATALDDAAIQAAARGAPDAAAELSELARKLTPADRPDQARNRGLRAAEYHFEAGDAGRAGSLLEEELVRSLPGSARAEVLRELGTIRAHSVSWPAAQELFEQALEQAGDDLGLRACIRRDLSWVGMMRGDFPNAASHAQAAVEVAESLNDTLVLSEALTVSAFTDVIRGRGEPMPTLDRAIELAELSEGSRVMPHPGFMYGVLLKWQDRLDAARSRFEAILAGVRERGKESQLPYILYHLSELECWAGDWDRAEAFADEGHETALQTGENLALEMLLYAKALVDAYRGRLDSARVYAEEGLARAEDTGAYFRKIQNLNVLGFIELCSGDPEAALRLFDQIEQLSLEAGIGEPGVVRYHGDFVEALVESGQLDRAEAVIAFLDERGQALGRVSAMAVADRSRALVYGSRGELGLAVGAAQDALKHSESLGMPFDQGRTLLVLGQVQRRDKQRGAARRSLEAALAIFERLGAAPWIERARAELARVGGRAQEVGQLTETERRVADLVAGGLSNPEVADSLFISRKTVEANLSRIYHKLGVRSRTELARTWPRGDTRRG